MCTASTVWSQFTRETPLKWETENIDSYKPHVRTVYKTWVENNVIYDSEVPLIKPALWPPKGVVNSESGFKVKPKYNTTRCLKLKVGG